MFKEWLAHPLTRGLDLNDPQTTRLRRRIIREKKFLRKIYCEWYQRIAASLPSGTGPVLEIGSGAGFLKEFVPGLVTSEVFPCPGIDVVINGLDMPFADGALRAIVMTDVLHHIPDVRGFFVEAGRCVRPGGRIVLIEPWATRWSRLIYTHLHHEPFEPQAQDWSFPSEGPLSGANGALPWILFARDAERFNEEFPEWQSRSIRPLMPFRYLVSGGVATRDLMPGWSFGLWRGAEKMLQPWMNTWAMFAEIVLERVEPGKQGEIR
jgi:SAM-dependent methyltransferase